MFISVLQRSRSTMTAGHVRARGAFTLIELLVVIAIIALLIGILVPSLAGARDAAKQSKCASALRQLSIAAGTHAADRKGLFSTGASDNRRDYGNGAFDEKGWIADYVNGSYCKPGQLLCPSSPSQASQNLNIGRINNNSYKTFNPVDIDRLIDEGYNSNFNQSWYMAHTDTKTRAPASPGPVNPSDVKLHRFNVGPMKDSSIRNTTPSKVPLFGDGTSLVLQDTVAYKGQVLTGAKALSDGPERGALGSGIVWGRQNYTDFGTAHGRGAVITVENANHRSTIGQMGFSDGHAESFFDTVRDGQFGGTTGTRNGYTGQLAEYHELEGKVFGGWLIRAGLNY